MSEQSVAEPIKITPTQEDLRTQAFAEVLRRACLRLGIPPKATFEKAFPSPNSSLSEGLIKDRP